MREVTPFATAVREFEHDVILYYNLVAYFTVTALIVVYLRPIAAYFNGGGSGLPTQIVQRRTLRRVRVRTMRPSVKPRVIPVAVTAIVSQFRFRSVAAVPVCAGDAEGDVATDCRSQRELVVKVRATARMPGTAIDPIRVASGEVLVVLSFAGGKQVIDVESIDLEAEAQLVLAGEADTVLVLRVRGGLELGAAAAVALVGEARGGPPVVGVRGGRRTHRSRRRFGDRRHDPGAGARRYRARPPGADLRRHPRQRGNGVAPFGIA